ncbi:MAG: type II toxin-antitoxin system ParD family antitoxin [Phormidesmis sp.]
MQLVLPPEIEAFVQRQVESGKYRSSVELAIAAIQLLQQQEEDIYQGRLTELQKEAEIGLEDLAQGRTVDGPTAMATIRENLRDRNESSAS